MYYILVYETALNNMLDQKSDISGSAFVYLGLLQCAESAFDSITDR